jgi:hypothetical protein
VDKDNCRLVVIANPRASRRGVFKILQNLPVPCQCMVYQMNKETDIGSDIRHGAFGMFRLICKLS